VSTCRVASNIANSNASRYDYDTHACVFNSWPYYMFNGDISSPIWQRLETILSAWIEMIERRKVAAVHKGLGNGPDPASGVSLDSKDPWGWAPWTQADLEDTLEAWNNLISAINNRLPEPRSDPLSRTSLFEVDDLRAAKIEEGSFAWEFYRKACKPHFRYLAPSLQLASREQLLSLPFKPAWESQLPKRLAMHGTGTPPDVFPLPILLGSQLAKSWVDYYQYEVGPVACGLYFDILDSRSPLSHPYEDAARVVLPYELDASTTARRLDGKAATGNADLYQIGQNPFETDRSATRLWLILKLFVAHVDAGEWKVDADGVCEPATVFDNFFVRGVEPDGDEAQGVRYSILDNMYL
jgi:hypothetical protein